MGFWIFMLIMNMLIPLTMICFGKMFQNHPPKQINSIFGYRTTWSMKNKDTWKFAHKYFGKLWYICGLLLLPLSIILMLSVLGLEEKTIGYTGGMICVAQLLFLIGSILPVELALRKNFDQQGNRRQEL